MDYPLQVVCYKARDGTREIAVKDRKEVEVGYLLPRPVWTLGSQVESVSRYQQLTQRNRNGLESVGELKGSTGSRKASILCKNSATGLGMRLGNCNVRQEGE